MHEETRFIDFDFDSLKETSWWVIALAVAVDAAFLVVAMHVILPFLRSATPNDSIITMLIKPTLPFSIVRFLLAALGVAMLVGGLSARDVGLLWEKLKTGALVVFGGWMVMQAIAALFSLVVFGHLALSPIWAPDKLPFVAGELMAQFLGNAFAEEVIFRGFLLTQVYLMLKGRISGRGRRVAVSLLVSQLIFSVTHIPQRLVTGYSLSALLASLLVVWVTGIVFGLLYLRTENIFVAIGLHALVNAPVTVVDLPSRAVGELLPLVLVLVLIFAWRPVRRWTLGTDAVQYA